MTSVVTLEDLHANLKPEAFHEAAKLANQDREPPEWLCFFLMHWSPDLVLRRAAFEGLPSRARMMEQLAIVESSAIVLAQALEEPAIMTFLQIPPLGPLLLRELGTRMLVSQLATRARVAAGSSALLDESGKGITGPGRAMPPDTYKPKEMCAAIVAEVWNFLHGEYPAQSSVGAGKAASAFWKASGGGLRGWGSGPAKSWRPDALEALATAAVGEFKQRVTAAMSAEQKSLQMQIVRHGAGTHLHDVRKLVGASDANFLEASRNVPQRLADAQIHQNIPGGVLLVFDGTVGASSYRYVGVIKAEKHSGFRRYKEKNATLTEFLDDLFLTPTQRLYKIGIFVETARGQSPPNGWDAYVFDTNIAKSHREAAAQYFYESFLGCALLEDGAYETVRFFDLTKEFVQKSDLSRDKKQDLVDALHTFVKAETAITFTASEYASQYLPTESQDAFRAFLDGKRFPSRAVVRDTSEMGPRLRRRRFRFGSEIELSVSTDALNSKEVVIEEGPAAKFGGKGKDPWTRVTIRRSLSGER